MGISFILSDSNLQLYERISDHIMRIREMINEIPNINDQVKEAINSLLNYVVQQDNSNNAPPIRNTGLLDRIKNLLN